MLQMWLFLYVCVVAITFLSPYNAEQTLCAFIDILSGQRLRNT